jgi:phosphoribosylformylglycinamidine synthase subunit PurS
LERQSNQIYFPDSFGNPIDFAEICSRSDNYILICRSVVHKPPNPQRRSLTNLQYILTPLLGAGGLTNTMKFIAEIDVMPQKEILDPQGKAVKLGLHNLGIDAIDNVRIGRHITLEVDADSKALAGEQVEIACRKLLANLIMEEFSYEIKEV